MACYPTHHHTLIIPLYLSPPPHNESVFFFFSRQQFPLKAASEMKGNSMLSFDSIFNIF